MCPSYVRGSRICGAAYRTMLRIAGRTLHRVRDTKHGLDKSALVNAR
jgi:hypothetical protein